MKQSEVKLCIWCGEAIFGRKRLYCSDAHRKAYKRQEQRELGENLKRYADTKLSALESAEREALRKYLSNLVKWERINASNPHGEFMGTVHAIMADIMQIILEGLEGQK